MLVFAPQLCEQLIRHAEREFPNEACGLLLGHRDDHRVRVDGYRPLRNVAADPTRQFAIEPLELVRTRGVLGVFHSHPDGTAAPSRTDVARAWPEHLVAIAAVRAGRCVELAVYEPPLPTFSTSSTVNTIVASGGTSPRPDLP